MVLCAQVGSKLFIEVECNKQCLKPQSSIFASYFGKVSVRVDLQRSGFAIPGILGPIAAVVYIFAADVFEFNHTTKSIGPGPDPNSTIDDERVWKSYEEITTHKFMPIMGYNEYRFRPVNDANPFKVEFSIEIFHSK